MGYFAVIDTETSWAVHRHRETHNAVLDALDELSIMGLLGISTTDYIPL